MSRGKNACENSYNSMDVGPSSTIYQLCNLKGVTKIFSSVQVQSEDNNRTLLTVLLKSKCNTLCEIPGMTKWS